MVGTNSALAEFLRLAAAKPFAWGEFDCGLWLADWVRLARGLSFDPAEGLRGQYTCARSASKALGHRGYAATVNEIAARCGLEMTDDPLRGDIALVRPIIGRRVTGAIRGSNGWWLLTPTGKSNCGLSMGESTVSPIMAWRI